MLYVQQGDLRQMELLYAFSVLQAKSHMNLVSDARIAMVQGWVHLGPYRMHSRMGVSNARLDDSPLA